MAILFPHTFHDGVNETASGAQVMENFNLLKELLEEPQSKKSIVAAEQTVTNVAYTAAPTPDEVALVVPENGLLMVAFEAMFKETNSGTGAAALFIDGNQLKVPVAPGGAGAAVRTQEAITGAAPANFWHRLASAPYGLICLAAGETNAAEDVATGQALALVQIGSAAGYNIVFSVEGQEVVWSSFGGTEKSAWGGLCAIHGLSSATHKVSVRYKSSAGSIKVKSRKLWAWTVS